MTRPFRPAPSQYDAQDQQTYRDMTAKELERCFRSDRAIARFLMQDSATRETYSVTIENGAWRLTPL